MNGIAAHHVDKGAFSLAAGTTKEHRYPNRYSTQEGKAQILSTVACLSIGIGQVSLRGLGVAMTSWQQWILPRSTAYAGFLAQPHSPSGTNEISLFC
jgi:hypothetical protein